MDIIILSLPFPPLPLSLSDGEDLMQRVIIIGTLMGFRKLCLQALHAVLERRIPFMFMSILDFKSNLRDKESRVSVMGSPHLYM